MKKKITKTLLSIVISLLPVVNFAQTYNMSNTPVSTCSGTFYDDGGSGGNYNDFASYTQTYTSSTGKTMVFNFTSFATSWITDILYIYDGPNNTYPLIGSYSNNTSPGIVTSTGTSLTFIFVPNSGGSNWTGWAATISCGATPLTPYSMNNSTVTACSGIFYDDGGVNSNYTNSQDKTMTFCSGTTDRLDFTFNNAGSALETGDSLFVYDGASTAAKALAILVKGSFIEKIQSSGTCLTFRFKSDAILNAKGWQATFQCVSTAPVAINYPMSEGVRYLCSGTFTDDGGPSGFYNDFASHSQTFYSSNGNRLIFDFTSFKTYYYNDILYIYDGPDNTYPLIGAFASYSSNNNPATITSSGTSLTFIFSNTQSNGTNEAGWIANVSCGTAPLTNYPMSSGFVTACSGVFYDDGNLNGNYTNSQNKIMTFCSGTSDMLEFTFNNNASALETGDSLFVYDGASITAKPIGIYVKNSTIEKFQSTGTCVTFRFKSDGTTNAIGWQANFKCVSTAPAATNYSMSSGVRYVCSGTFTDDGGLANDYNDFTQRTQTFVSYSGCGIKVTFAQFSTSSAADYLKVYDGMNTSATLLGTYSLNQNGLVIQSSGSALTFEFIPNSANSTTAGWNATLQCTNITSTPIASSNGPVCEGNDLQLNATLVASASYLWSGPNGFSSNLQNPTITAATTAASGIYSVTATIGTCSSSSSTVSVSIQTKPADPVLSSNSPICAGSNLNLSCTSIAGASYSWSGPNSFSSTQQNPVISAATLNANGTYTATVTKGSCSFTKTTNATVNPTPGIITISSNSPVCAGTDLNLNSNFVAGVTYSWTGPNGFTSSQQNPTITNAPVANAGNYMVTAVLGTCSTQSNINAVVTAFPGSLTVGSNSPVCESGTLNLNSTTLAGATYSWTGPNGFTSTAQNFVLTNCSLSAAGNYAVTASLGTCSAQGNVAVVVNVKPSTPTSGSNTPVCEGTNINLNTSVLASAAYFWSGPNGFTAVTQNPSIASAGANNSGSYSLKVTVNGCDSDPSTITVDVNVLSTFSADNLGPYCAGDDIYLTASNLIGATYQWTGPKGFSSSLQNPVINNASAANAGLYKVKVTAGSCSTQKNTTVVVNPKPAKPTLSVDNSTLILTSSPAQNYQWKMDGVILPGETFQDIFLLNDGQYTVVVTGANGCTAESAPFNYNVTGTISSSNTENSIYPNPTNGLLYLSLNKGYTEPVKVTLQNFAGEIVKSKTFATAIGSTYTIDLSEIPKGMYTLGIESGSNHENRKIIIY